MVKTADETPFVIKSKAPLVIVGFCFFGIVQLLGGASNHRPVGAVTQYQQYLADNPQFHLIISVIMLASVVLSFFFVFTRNYWKVETTGISCFYGGFFPLKTIPKERIHEIILTPSGNKQFSLSAVLTDKSSITIVEDRDLFKIELTGEKMASILNVPVENRAAASGRESGKKEEDLAGIPFYDQNVVTDDLTGYELAEKKITVEKTREGHLFTLPTMGIWGGTGQKQMVGLITGAFLPGFVAFLILLCNQKGLWGLLNNVVFMISLFLAVIFSYFALQKSRKKWVTVLVNKEQIVLGGTDIPPHSIPLSSIQQLEAITGNQAWGIDGYLGIKTRDGSIGIQDVDFPVLQVMEHRIKQVVRELKQGKAS